MHLTLDIIQLQGTQKPLERIGKEYDESIWETNFFRAYTKRIKKYEKWFCIIVTSKKYGKGYEQFFQSWPYRLYGGETFERVFYGGFDYD